MKIESVRPIASTFGTDRERMSFCFVEIVTDDGRTGWGEACDSYGCSYPSVLAAVIDDVLAPLLVGQELEAVAPLAERMRLFTRRRLGDAWVGAQARSALEIALWDLVGQATGLPIHRLLGSMRDSVEVYASSAFLEEGPASYHLGILRPLLDRGVRKIKVRTGPDWRADLDTLADLRRELGAGIELMIDGSETYTLPTARALADELHRLDIRWLEEPLPQGARAGIEALVAHSPVPIAYGEHLYGADEAVDAMRRRQLDVLQPDASTAGGIAEACRMANAAAGFGVRVVPHVCAGPVSLAANLHVAASVHAIRTIEFPPTLFGVWQAFGDGMPFGLEAIDDGHVRIPDRPGLGVTLRTDVVTDHPYVPAGARVSGTTTGLPDRFVGDR